MSAELCRRFLARNGGLCAWVGVGSGLLAFFLASLYPEMTSEDAGSVSSSWPDLMKVLFGDPLLAFTDIYAWLHLEIFHITFWLVHGGLAALLAARILAVEVDEKTLDILLSVPISRTRVVTSRLLALALLSALSAAPVVLACALGIRAVGLPLRPGPILMATSAGVALSLVIAALTFLVSVWIPRQTQCILVAFGVIGALFLLEEMLVPLVPWLRGSSVFNPFHHYRIAEILVHDAGAGRGPWVLLAMFLGLSAFATAAFSRRDVLV